MIPRINSEYVQEILDSDISNKEKARQIRIYDYNCLCRETDGRVVQKCTEKQILEDINARTK